MEKKLYFVDINDIPEDKHYTELTDEEFIKLSHTSYDSLEKFAKDFNEEHIPSDICNYCRYI